MNETPTGHRHDSVRYEIRVKGHLDARWSAWLDGLDLTKADDGTTLISGEVADQAALHGLLQKLRDMALPLLSVERTEPTQEPSTESRPSFDPTGSTS